MKNNGVAGRQLTRFIVVGFSAVFTDLMVYLGLNSFISPSLAKSLSFIAGTFVSYFLNKFWTFQKQEKSFSEITKFVFLYLVTLGINVFVNKVVLNISGITELGFLFATAMSTVLNFIGMKWWVFKK